MNKNPLVSVLVHTKNSSRTILEHLESIKNQSYKNVEIIVVDNNSQDQTLKIAKQFTDNIFNAGPERSAQRNFGAKKAKGDYYLVPDSDMILDKNVIRECVLKVEEDPEVKAVIICEKSFGKGFWAKCKTLERECYVGDNAIEAARFFDKNVFWEMGGYDENMTGPEDWDLPQRIKKKYQIGRIKSQIIHDEGKVTLAGLMKKKYYYAKKVSVYLRKHPLSTTGSQIIYLLRPAFYRNWKKLAKNPLITCGMIIMLAFEQTAGFFGFISATFNSK
ncbi:MAG: glycosyltransferase [Candidatus Levybacteria bacterium]|nr:glycosyltransferase [Candidatus Levybacteria bacterium]